MEVRDEALGVIPGRTASSADLGGKFFSLKKIVIVNVVLTVDYRK